MKQPLKSLRIPRLPLASLSLISALFALAPHAHAEAVLEPGKPVKLYICSGQSNMGGGGTAGAYNEAMPSAEYTVMGQRFAEAMEELHQEENTGGTSVEL